jgi:hypothetical protein
VSRPLPPLQVSLPPPPFRLCLPPWPSSLSLPPPPLRVSLPGPPTDDVVPAEGLDFVVAAQGGDHVGPAGADELIGPRGPQNGWDPVRARSRDPDRDRPIAVTECDVVGAPHDEGVVAQEAGVRRVRCRTSQTSGRAVNPHASRHRVRPARNSLAASPSRSTSRTSSRWRSRSSSPVRTAISPAAPATSGRCAGTRRPTSAGSSGRACWSTCRT